MTLSCIVRVILQWDKSNILNKIIKKKDQFLKQNEKNYHLSTTISISSKIIAQLSLGSRCSLSTSTAMSSPVISWISVILYNISCQSTSSMMTISTTSSIAPCGYSLIIQYLYDNIIRLTYRCRQSCLGIFSQFARFKQLMINISESFLRIIIKHRHFIQPEHHRDRKDSSTERLKYIILTWNMFGE